MVLTLPLPITSDVAGVYRAQAQGLSRVRQRLWDRADKQVLDFPSATSCSTSFYVLRRSITDDLRFDGIVKQVLRAESKLESPFLDILMPITFPIAGRVPCSVNAVFINPTFPASVCPFCLPLEVVSVLVSGPSRGSTHVTRRCA